MRDLDEVLDLDLRLPIGGKVYTVHPPRADVGVDLMNRLAIGIADDAGIPLDDEQRGAITITDDQLPDFGRQCLGPVLDELEADGVDPQRIEFAITTAFFAWTVGKAYAELYWETAGNLERPTVQSPVEPQTATRTRTAAGSTTPTSASASGTTKKKATAPKG